MSTRGAAGGMLALSSLVLFNACGPRPLAADATPRDDSVSILELVPPATTALERGRAVALDVSVGYRLVSSDVALIRLLVQDDKDETIAAFERSEVKKGDGTLRFAGIVPIPDTAQAVTLVLEMYELRKRPVAAIPEEPEEADIARRVDLVRMPVRKAVATARFATR